MIEFLKILDISTGLFCNPGRSYTSWNKTGKTWSSVGALGRWMGIYKTRYNNPNFRIVHWKINENPTLGEYNNLNAAAFMEVYRNRPKAGKIVVPKEADNYWFFAVRQVPGSNKQLYRNGYSPMGTMYTFNSLKLSFFNNGYDRTSSPMQPFDKYRNRFKDYTVFALHRSLSFAPMQIMSPPQMACKNVVKLFEDAVSKLKHPLVVQCMPLQQPFQLMNGEPNKIFDACDPVYPRTR